jgi:hypothetical protein
MKILQKIVLSVALATSMAAFSTSILANEAKAVVSVTTILETTISHIDAAMAAIDSGEKTETVLLHIKEARQAQKDITVGKLDQNRQKASAKLIIAGRDLKDGKVKEAKAVLAEAKVAFEELITLSK